MRSVPGLLLVLVATACAAAPALPRRSPAPSGSAPHLLNPFIAFYAGFDGGSASADLAVGDPQPLRLEGTARFVPGRIGQALLLGTAGGGARVEYDATHNLDFARPGALSFWMRPAHWVDPAGSREREILGLLARRARNGGSFALNRTGFRAFPPREDHLLVGFFKLPGIPQTFVRVRGTETWTSRGWHLVVLDWSRSGFSVSVDGASFEQASFPVALPGDAFQIDGRETALAVGNRSSETTAIDELAIYTRPLRLEEARALRDGR